MKVAAAQANPQTSLAEVKAQFTHWRTTRESRRVPVPESLKVQALNLLKHNKTSHVIKTLGINSSMLKSWQADQVPKPLASNSTFVPVQIPESSQDSIVELKLSYGQGVELCVKGEFSLTQLITLAQGLRPSMEPSL
jgi:hypothetical protein